MKLFTISRNGQTVQTFYAETYNYDFEADCYLFELEDETILIFSNDNIEIKIETQEAVAKRQSELAKSIMSRWEEQEKKRKRFWSRF